MKAYRHKQGVLALFIASLMPSIASAVTQLHTHQIALTFEYLQPACTISAEPEYSLGTLVKGEGEKIHSGLVEIAIDCKAPGNTSRLTVSSTSTKESSNTALNHNDVLLQLIEDKAGVDTAVTFNNTTEFCEATHTGERDCLLKVKTDVLSTAQSGSVSFPVTFQVHYD